MKETTPSGTISITDLETLKVIADPLRNQILESLILQPLTVRQVAEQLGLAPKRLYYHIRLLENHGLIHVAETRLVSNMVEKVYRASATRLAVDPALLSFATDEGQANMSAIHAAALDMTREDLQRSLEARAVQLAEGAEEHPRRVIINRVLSRLDDAQVHAFEARLEALLQDFEAADADEAAPTPAQQTYALTVVFYPRFLYPDATDDDSPVD